MVPPHPGPPGGDALDALEAAEALAAQGIAVEVIDPRSLCPLDLDTIVASVGKTGPLVVVHEAVEIGRVGAETGSTGLGGRVRRPG